MKGPVDLRSCMRKNYVAATPSISSKKDRQHIQEHVLQKDVFLVICVRVAVSIIKS